VCGRAPPEASPPASTASPSLRIHAPGSSTVRCPNLPTFFASGPRPNAPSPSLIHSSPIFFLSSPVAPSSASSVPIGTLGGFFILFLTSQKYLNTAKCSSFLFWHKLMAKYSQLPCMLWYEPFSFKFIYSCYFYIVFIHVLNFHAHVYIYSVCGEFLHLIQGFGLDSKFYFILA
jgi:hypothetical protein